MLPKHYTVRWIGLVVWAVLSWGAQRETHESWRKWLDRKCSSFPSLHQEWPHWPCAGLEVHPCISFVQSACKSRDLLLQRGKSWDGRECGCPNALASATLSPSWGESSSLLPLPTPQLPIKHQKSGPFLKIKASLCWITMAHPNPAEIAFERMKLSIVRQVSNTQVYQLSCPDLQGLQSSIYTSKLNNAREQCQHCHIVKRIPGVFSA